MRLAPLISKPLPIVLGFLGARITPASLASTVTSSCVITGSGLMREMVTGEVGTKTAGSNVTTSPL